MSLSYGQWLGVNDGSVLGQGPRAEIGRLNRLRENTHTHAHGEKEMERDRESPMRSSSGGYMRGMVFKGLSLFALKPLVGVVPK
jgi:hypothetical protein